MKRQRHNAFEFGGWQSIKGRMLRLQLLQQAPGLFQLPMAGGEAYAQGAASYFQTGFKGQLAQGFEKVDLLRGVPVRVGEARAERFRSSRIGSNRGHDGLGLSNWLYAESTIVAEFDHYMYVAYLDQRLLSFFQPETGKKLKSPPGFLRTGSFQG
jgi:hypothetical protein